MDGLLGVLYNPVTGWLASPILAWLVTEMIGLFKRILGQGARHAFFTVDHWYVYHHTTSMDGQRIFLEYRWTTGWLRRQVTATPLDARLNSYHGRVRTYNDGTLAVAMKDEATGERYYVWIGRTITDTGSLFGIKVGLDYQSRECASVYLFSKEQLSEPEAKRRIGEHVNATEPWLIQLR